MWPAALLNMSGLSYANEYHSYGLVGGLFSMHVGKMVWAFASADRNDRIINRFLNYPL